MWFDRLTQQELRSLPAQVESGRFQWQGNSDECLNGHTPIRTGGLLVSDGAERCQLKSGSFSFLLAPTEQNARNTLLSNAITTIGKQLEGSSNRLLSPILPAAVVDSESHLLPIERTLHKVLSKGHLHQISRSPRLDIRYEEEVTDVARAKRLAKGALVHLASHSECWQRQTLSGVVPKKVKARFSEDDFDIYENRVFARLLDKLEKHLSLRIRTVKQLTETLDQALNFYENQGIDHRLTHKICTLWGQTFDEEATLETMVLLQETLEQLNSMHLSIRNLKQSGLYLTVARQGQVGHALYRTNILNHDAHYRHLAILWDELNRHQSTSQCSPCEHFQYQLQLAEYYSRYAGLVLQHALQPYLAKEQAQDFRADRLVINWAGRTLTVERNQYDWKLSVSNQEGQVEILLHLIPWLGFTAIPVLESVAGNGLIAWPAAGQIPDNLRLSGDYDLALSPMDLYCIERVGWYIDQKLSQTLVRDYARPIEKVPQIPVEWLRRHPLQPSIMLKNTHPPAIQVLEDLMDVDLASLQEKLSCSNAKGQARALKARVIEIRALQTCPVCQWEHNRLQSQRGDGFRVECTNCSSSRYLRKKSSQREFELKLNGESIDNSFSRRGRWYSPGVLSDQFA